MTFLDLQNFRESNQRLDQRNKQDWQKSHISYNDHKFAFQVGKILIGSEIFNFYSPFNNAKISSLTKL